MRRACHQGCRSDQRVGIGAGHVDHPQLGQRQTEGAPQSGPQEQRRGEDAARPSAAKREAGGKELHGEQHQQSDYGHLEQVPTEGGLNRRIAVTEEPRHLMGAGRPHVHHPSDSQADRPKSRLELLGELYPVSQVLGKVEPTNENDRR